MTSYTLHTHIIFHESVFFLWYENKFECAWSKEECLESSYCLTGLLEYTFFTLKSHFQYYILLILLHLKLEMSFQSSKEEKHNYTVRQYISSKNECTNEKNCVVLMKNAITTIILTEKR